MSTGSGAAAFDMAARAAEFSFIGSVQRLSASDVPTVPADDTTVVVAVEEVLHAPEALADYSGQNVTVRLAEPRSVTEGQRAVFFTTILAMGDSLAVTELEHHPVDQEPAALAGRVRQVQSDSADQLLQDRTARADVIVSGRVADVRVPSAASVLAGGTEAPVSEHDPQWMEAVLAVDSVIKGDPGAGPTTVLFPASMDIVWARAPKFQVGHEGVYLLHRQEPSAALPTLRAGGPPVLTALDPLDVQPPEEAARVRQLTSRT